MPNITIIIITLPGDLLYFSNSCMVKFTNEHKQYKNNYYYNLFTQEWVWIYIMITTFSYFLCNNIFVDSRGVFVKPGHSDQL